ncbi:uncharacterized protein LOC106176548 [Lingula anatina]|uniref:3-oxoacyl-[acyl-carrier-protein] reductase n=1 Tax=Lingula anatina TaxID=7574 RepID=A0A1S3JVK1_LINAN|nr:uncharacterized protein LOC106176548 [Lingula anatina]|eukprot:XP_013414435.1 uncharacterized protein LOC106176548 [Lingula anatina]
MSVERHLDGKVALVTGSTSGIGLAIAHGLAKRGASIILTGFGDEELISKLKEDFTSKYKCRVDYIDADLSKVADINELFTSVIKLYPEGVDVLINNAGYNHVCLVEEYPEEKWDDMVAVMLSAPFHLCKRFIPLMKRKGWGRILITSSVHGMISTAGKAVYSAVKHGVVGLAKGIALEVVDYGITCNTLCPGFVDTPVTQKQIKQFVQDEGISLEQAKVDLVSKRQPTKTFIEPEHIAEYVAFICSPYAAQITGSAMPIEGGWLSK